MDPLAIIRRAGEILSVKGKSAILSEQAAAVIEAICEAAQTDSVLVNQALAKQINAVKETPTGRMKKPTREEVLAHGVKIELPAVQCDKFFDHFESNGWKVGIGKSPMKLWTAALANWKRTWQERNSGPVNSSVAVVRDQSALKRVEERILFLRGQFPLTEERRKLEWNELRTERQRLLQQLGFKV